MAEKKNVLVVEDDTNARESIRLALLRAAGEAIEVHSCDSGEQFYEYLGSGGAMVTPDLYVVDVMLNWKSPLSKGDEGPEPPDSDPDFDEGGITCVRSIRLRGIDSPVIFYTIVEKSGASRDSGIADSLLSDLSAKYFRKGATYDALAKKIVVLLRVVKR